jgi:hypothetical protein
MPRPGARRRRRGHRHAPAENADGLQRVLAPRSPGDGRALQGAARHRSCRPGAGHHQTTPAVGPTRTRRCGRRSCRASCIDAAFTTTFAGACSMASTRHTARPRIAARRSDTLLNPRRSTRAAAESRADAIAASISNQRAGVRRCEAPPAPCTRQLLHAFGSQEPVSPRVLGVGADRRWSFMPSSPSSRASVSDRSRNAPRGRTAEHQADGRTDRDPSGHLHASADSTVRDRQAPGGDRGGGLQLPAAAVNFHSDRVAQTVHERNPMIGLRVADRVADPPPSSSPRQQIVGRGGQRISRRRGCTGRPEVR